MILNYLLSQVLFRFKPNLKMPNSLMGLDTKLYQK